MITHNGRTKLQRHHPEYRMAEMIVDTSHTMIGTTAAAPAQNLTSSSSKTLQHAHNNQAQLASVATVATDIGIFQTIGKGGRWRSDCSIVMPILRIPLQSSDLHIAPPVL